MFKIDNLFFSFTEKTVLDSISTIFKRNEICVVLGKSGCGKTTLLNLISGLLHPTSGEIENGFKNISYLTQKPILLPYRNSFENALLGIELRSEIFEEQKKEALCLFEQFDLTDSFTKYPNELSGGMKQRLGLIQTLLIDAELYLLDEPFNAIDRNNLSKIEHLIWEKFKKKESASIIVTHDIEQALLVSDKIIMLSSNPGTIQFNLEFSKEFKSLSPRERKKNKQFDEYFIKVVKEFSQL